MVARDGKLDFCVTDLVLVNATDLDGWLPYIVIIRSNKCFFLFLLYILTLHLYIFHNKDLDTESYFILQLSKTI